jgi:sugar O-acyltransferase (sialic acid O-acetyltransferase NeuD family)
MKENIILIGGGGHCRACIDVIEQEGRFTIAGIVDVPEKKQHNVLGYPVIGSDADLAELIKTFPNVMITLGHIKSPTRRMELFNDLMQMGARFPVIQSPLAYVSSHACVAEGTIVMHYALINASASVGRNCIINTKALIEHDAKIGDHCHITSAAVISGGVTIGQETFVGGNSMTREYVTIGEGSIIGGGSGVERFASIQCLQRPIKIAIFGASGFSRETADVALIDQIEELVFIDLDTTRNTYYGFPLLPEEHVRDLEKKGFLFAIGLGDNATRKKIYSKFKTLNYPNLIHSSASLGYKQQSQLALTQGNIITSGVRFTNNIKMGNFGIFNLNCTIGHDCIIEDFVNIAPGANISGNVKLKEGAYIGTNAVVLQGESIEKKMIIGAFSNVGAGAVVTRDVDDSSTVVGIPAKSIK